MIEINNYFQTIDDRRRERSAAWACDFEHRKSLELEALYDDRLQEATRDLEARLQARFQTAIEAERKAERKAELQTAIPIPIPIQQNKDLSPLGENTLALAS